MVPEVSARNYRTTVVSVYAGSNKNRRNWESVNSESKFMLLSLYTVGSGDVKSQSLAPFVNSNILQQNQRLDNTR